MTNTRLVRRYWMLTAGVGAVDFLFGATYVVLLSQRGLDGGQIGLAVGIGIVVSALFELPSGAWGDKFGQRRMTTLGLLLWSAGLVTFGSADGFALSMAGLCLRAAGRATFSGAPVSLVVNALRESGAEDAVPGAIRRAQIAQWTASIAGAAVSLALLRVVGPASIVTIGGVVFLGFAGWVRLTWVESTCASTVSVRSHITTGIRLSVSRPLLGLLLLSCLLSLPYGFMVVGWQPAAVKLAHLPITLLAALYLAFSVAAAVGTLAAKYAARLVRPTPIIGLVMMMALGLAAVGAFSGPAFYGGFLFAELAAGFLTTAVSVLQQLNFADAYRNTLTSGFSTVAALVWAVGTFLFGLVWRARGVGPALVWSGVGTITLTCLLWPIIYRHPPAHDLGTDRQAPAAPSEPPDATAA